MSINKQRNLLFATDCSPRKPVSQTPPVPERRRRSQDWDQLKMNFDDPHLTGRGGMPLMFMHERNLDLKGALGRAIKMDRRSDAFTPAECSRFLIDSKVEGIERLYQMDEPRVDPVYRKEYGLTELPCGKTVGCYLKEFEDNHIQSLKRLNDRFTASVLRQAYNRVEGADRDEDESDPAQDLIQKDRKGRIKVGLDFDSTCMAVYGKQEGSDRGRHPRKKDNPGFQPKFAFLSGLDVMACQRLYPESQGLNSEFDQFYQESTRKIPDPMVLAYVRGDAALYSKENIKRFEQSGLRFGVSARKTSHMWEAIELLPEQCWQEYEDGSGGVVELAELYYKPATWPGPHRVYILSRRRTESEQGKLFEGEKYKVFAYLTNYEGTLWERYKFCVGRCTVEKCIRESKLGFDWNHLPSGSYEANRAYLGHVQLAYNLMISFKLTALGGNAARWSADTIRRRILTLPGRFSPRNQNILHLPDWWPHRHHLTYAKRQLTDFKN